ncbi:MraY family glycosyltransferase [Metapseudomonas otitidis]|uniref:MraY family glycosyltransferase n=1 Tax=Metapseudomonas otitidis TaxID=319939 RepID=UPI0013F5C7FA|nr:glycosyltransferase family 4 protein [Pseudomonas otitidis]
MRVYWFLPLAALFSLLLTWGVRHYALSRRLLDIPNERSSHTIPTPRGGGVAIVLSFLIALFFLMMEGNVNFPVAWALVGSGLGVALVGFLDDHGHIAARWRLIAHFVAAFWALYWLGGLPPLQIAGVTKDLGWFGHVVAAFYLVWLLNLYNFMDGIDGIAASEAVIVCIGGALLYAFTGMLDLIWTPLFLAVIVSGFLFWNFPPARIFMGDAGSGFLGITLGILTLQAAWTDMNLFWGWLILLAVFISDATFTLIRRLLNGDKPHEAHRSHAYQYASRLYRGHLPVILAVIGINVFWLLPLALLVGTNRVDECVGLMSAYAPLVLLCVKYRAGLKELGA